MLASRVYDAQNDKARAERTLRQVLAIDSSNIKAMLALADLLRRQHRPEEAKRVLDQLLARRPMSIESQTTMAALLEQTGRPANAKAVYEEIVARDQHAITATLRLAALYGDAGEKLDVALAFATRAKQQMPDDPAVNDVLGWIYVKREITSLGVTELEAAVRRAPANATYRYHLGTAYMLSGDIDEAMAQFTRALEIDPRSLTRATHARRCAT